MRNSKLIINADDYGADSNINSAIATCFEKNIINSATMMVNTDGFEEAVELAHQYNFSDKIGIHFNLTWERSLTDLTETGLTNDNGIFIKKSIASPKLFFSTTTKNKIKNEIKQQYNKILEAKIHPTHIDSHHHIHTIPWIAKIFIELAKKENQKIRITNGRFRKNLILLAYHRFLNNQYKKNQINFSDRFDKVHTFLNNYNKENNKNLRYEIMVHPVYKNGVLLDNVEKTHLEESLRNLKNIFNSKNEIHKTLIF